MKLPHWVAELTWFPHQWRQSNPFLSWSEPSSSHHLYFVFCQPLGTWLYNPNNILLGYTFCYHRALLCERRNSITGLKCRQTVLHVFSSNLFVPSTLSSFCLFFILSSMQIQLAHPLFRWEAVGHYVSQSTEWKYGTKLLAALTVQLKNKVTVASYLWQMQLHSPPLNESFNYLVFSHLRDVVSKRVNFKTMIHRKIELTFRTDFHFTTNQS